MTPIMVRATPIMAFVGIGIGLGFSNVMVRAWGSLVVVSTCACIVYTPVSVAVRVGSV